MRSPSPWLSQIVLPLLAFGGTVAVAVAGALLTEGGTGQVNVGVEQLSASTGGVLAEASALIPLGFAFGAGMVSAVNPCGFTMLPVYLGLYLGGGHGEPRAEPAGRRFEQALLVAAAVSAGFVVLFAAIGIAIGVGAQVLVRVFPWIGLAVGVVMIGVGAWLLSGRALYAALGERLGARIGDPRRSGLRSFFLFGISYGTASLSCTLPVFLSVVGGSIAVQGLLVALGQFILYGLGMGAVILALTVSLAVFQAGLVQPLRRIQPYVERASALLALLAGAYIVYYWLTLGGLLRAVV